MKQTTKVLLPLGLLMSIVIPVTVKSLFMETDFFSNKQESSYSQPMLQPDQTGGETNMKMGSSGLEVEFSEASTGKITIKSNKDGEQKSYYSDPKDGKISVPVSELADGKLSVE
jgi:hypothetical protein